MTRVLPRDEWHRLPSESDIPKALPYLRPEDVQVVVVERDGEIVATWAVLRVVQLEGVWIAPAYRKRASVARRLMRATLDLARTLTPYWAFTGSQSAEVSALLTQHLGATRLPMEPFVIPLRPLPCR